VVWAVIVAFSFVMLLPEAVQTLPKQPRCWVIFGKSGRAQDAATCHPRAGAKFVVPLIQDCAWLTLEPNADRDSAARRAVDGEYPRQRAQRIHCGRRHHAGNRCRTPPSVCWASNRHASLEAGRRHDLRPVAAGDRLDADRGHSTATATSFSKPCRTRWSPSLRKIGLVLINVNITDITDESGYIEAIRSEGGLAGDSEGPRRRGRQRADGRGPRGRGRAREVRQCGQRPQGPRDWHPRRPARAGGPGGGAGEGAERSASRRPPTSATPR